MVKTPRAMKRHSFFIIIFHCIFSYTATIAVFSVIRKPFHFRLRCDAQPGAAVILSEQFPGPLHQRIKAVAARRRQMLVKIHLLKQLLEIHLLDFLSSLAV